MPAYQYKCKCGHEFELFMESAKMQKTAKCVKCSMRAKKVFIAKVAINTGKGGRIPGPCYSLDDSPESAKGIYIRSKEHFKEEAKKRGLYPAGLS